MATRAYVISLPNKGVVTVASNKNKAISICEELISDNDSDIVIWDIQEFENGLAKCGNKTVEYKRFKIY